MAQDRSLLRRLRLGDRNALRSIYEKYKDDLLTVAMCLLTDMSTAEDCLHDVFVSLAADLGGMPTHLENPPAAGLGMSRALGIRKNLKGYLVTCIANRARDYLRKKARQDITITELHDVAVSHGNPADWLAQNEESRHLCRAIAKLPYQQREVVTLHLQSDMTFKQIAHLQQVSINTTRSRYRYGLDKLRSLLKENQL